MKPLLPSHTHAGFIGLGAMGGAMARHLIGAGYPLTVLDLAPERVAALTRLGARAAASAADLVASCDVVCTSLPSSESFVGFARAELLPGAGGGQVFIDFGTTVAFETRRLHADFAARGAVLLDVPVSGGAEGAEKGRLRMFGGGDREAFEAARPLLVAIGGADRLSYCGPAGSGQVAKGVNQLKSALQTAALLESLAFAVRSGVSAEVIAAAFGAGTPEQASGIVKFAREVAGNPAAHFDVKFRELPYFLAEAEAAGFPLPLTQALFRFCDSGERVAIDDGRAAPSFWRELMAAAP